MAINLDSYFGATGRAIVAQEKRATIIANNLANANTPNFKAKDLDFDEYLAASMSGSSQQLKLTNPNHISTNADFSVTLTERKPTHMSLDGNTVDKDVETTEFAKNSLSYQASLSFLTSKIKYMMSALKGE